MTVLVPVFICVFAVHVCAGCFASSVCLAVRLPAIVFVHACLADLVSAALTG